MKFSPGVYVFVWYEDDEIKVGKKTVRTRYIKRWTYTLALNDDNAVENTLNMARSTDAYDDMIFSYAKMSVWLTVLRLLTWAATSTKYSVIRETHRQLYGGDTYSDLVRYRPADSPKWKKKKA